MVERGGRGEGQGRDGGKRGGGGGRREAVVEKGGGGGRGRVGLGRRGKQVEGRGKSDGGRREG